MISLVLFVGRYVVPRILDYLARRNHREAFFLAALAAIFGAALAMDRAGMSMALGAFLMGMMLSTSRYSLQIEATMEPHKGLLMSLFFVAVGMSVDVAAVVQHPYEFVMHVLVIISVKVAVLYGLCLAFGSGRNTALRVAFLLAQGGEFGFVVFGAGKALGAVNDQIFVTAIAVISVTMLLTPLLVKTSKWLAQRSGADASVTPLARSWVAAVFPTSPLNLTRRSRTAGTAMGIRCSLVIYATPNWLPAPHFNRSSWWC